MNTVTYNPSTRLFEHTYRGTTRFYTLWNLARLGVVWDEVLARAILDPNVPQTV